MPISNILNGHALRIAPERWPDWYPPTEILQRKPKLREHMTPFLERRFGNCGRFPFRVGEGFSDPGFGQRRWFVGRSLIAATSQSGPELVAHHVAGAAGGGKLLAKFVERDPIVVGDGDDVALRRPQAWQFPKHHDRLAVADQ